MAQFLGSTSKDVFGVNSFLVQYGRVSVTPQIIEQPRDFNVVQGEPLDILVQASGEALKYQWYKGSERILGATASSLTIEPTTSSDSGDYFVVVSNDKGNSDKQGHSSCFRGKSGC